ncbi:MAG: DNA alkylation repair protein [Flammeovirgaceae bacterium]
MSNALKDKFYNRNFYQQASHIFSKVISSFDQAQFIEKIFDNSWNNKALKERIRHTAQVLHHFMPKEFSKAKIHLIEIVDALQKEAPEQFNFEYTFLADYVELYGLEHFKESMEAIERITQFVSCEFAIRPFFMRYEKETLAQMLDWSKHTHFMVRRLASEGSRPRLPWAMALPQFKKNPLPLIPILENLKNDDSEIVRRSVANHLNDIAKDHPEKVLQITEQWFGNHANTDALLKHACRTLLKKGNPKALKIFGIEENNSILIQNFEVQTSEVKIGDYLVFSFTLKNTAQTPVLVRLEYGIYYKKANGELSKKVFKISEKMIEPLSTNFVNRKQSFKPITTRVFYRGEHYISLIVNGKESKLLPFELS